MSEITTLNEFTAEQKWEYMKRNPRGFAHLLGLLAAGKGDELAFENMVNRIMCSARAAGQLERKEPF